MSSCRNPDCRGAHGEGGTRADPDHIVLHSHGRRGQRTNLAGLRFGRLVAREFAGHNRHRQVLWACTCDCGNETVTRSGALLSGTTRSCGCLQTETLQRIGAEQRHGEARRGNDTAEYRAWRAMRARCANSRRPEYARYGGRGIRVCDRWRNSFENFLADMGRRPSPQHSLDRINNDGHYEPTNCRWATRTEQNNNQRRTFRVRVGDLLLTRAQAARHLGFSTKVIARMLRRGQLERAS